MDDVSIRRRLAQPPRVPRDIARFSTGDLFGQPGLFAAGPPMEPAVGHRHSDASLEAVMIELVGTVGEPVFDAWNRGETAVRRLTYGAPSAPGRVVGDDAAGARVVNDRYRAEDARLLLPSIVHDLLWTGPGAGHAEETLLHALGAYVHAQLLARDPGLGALTTELARRQNSVTITLLNSRRPGSAAITLVAPDGPGTVPGGVPGMQTPDFWSVPFGPVAGDGGRVPDPARRVLAAAAGVSLEAVPVTYDDALGDWCATGLADVLTPAQQLGANEALGLL